MKKFKFKFEVVLEVRRNRENEALRNLADAQREHQTEIRKKNDLELALKQSLERRELLGKTPAQIQSFQAEQDFIDGNKRRIIQAEYAIYRAAKKVEKVMRFYLQAKRQTRVMETLYEQEYQKYRIELAKKEQKELDDLMVMRNRLKEDPI